MKSKHIGVVAIVAICITVLLSFLNLYSVLVVPSTVTWLSWLLVVIALISYYKYKSLWVIGAILLLSVALVFSLQFQSVQTYIAKKAAKYLSGELKTRIEISSIYVKPFKSLVLEGLYVQDREGDTLISSPKFTVDLNLLSLELRKVSVNKLQMDNGKFYIKQYRDSTTNLEFIVNYFNTGKPNVKKRKPFDITFDKITLNNIAFKYKNFNADPKSGNSVNFNDVYLTNLNTTILNLDTREHLAKAEVRNLTFHEKSGFYLRNLSTSLTLDKNKMEFKNLNLETPKSHVTDYVLMTYDGFKAFRHFNSSVFVKAHFKDSRIYPGDISYFAPEVKKIDMNIELEGDISGHVNNIKARNFEVKTGKATYFKGNFDIKGLPKISETFLSLNFDQIFSNKKDADYIIKTLTGKENQIPTEINKFGNIYFKGQFTGFPKDFIAHGEFKTSLGRIVSDINMKIGKTPVYTGTIKTFDFNLGELLDQKDLGRVSLTASVKGSGFKKSQLQESLNTTVSNIVYKGYRYTNIKINGTYNNNLFSGKVNINDPNVKLDFDGNMDLKNKDLPLFNFTAKIQSANLHELKLIKDTVQIDADLQTNFSGTNLDNIQGDLQIRKIRLTNAKTTLYVDSLSLLAKGTGNDRSLAITSDILDASIRGQYDLKTLRSYFISVAKKYVPSIGISNVTPGEQNFELRLRLKNFEPLSLLFAPDVKIPFGASINGKFVSAENSTSLNGLAKLVQYKKIKADSLILDVSNNEKAMNVFLTSSRVNLTDSLYIKNVNVSNIIKNDSVSLNIKLSDKNATNQLDLNALVEFASDTTQKLSLLPSDVIINHEVWRIQDQVSLKYDKGKTMIDNFELFRDDQLLTLNGILSSDPEDQLKMKFEKFKLSTFNSLTKGAGQTMQGLINGDMNISAAMTKTPRIDSRMTIDSIMLNNVPVGNLKLNADFDNSTKLVNVDMKILKKEAETVNFKGTYNTEENDLKLSVTMRDSELIIFQPFLKRLVSNLQGRTSADLEITGKVFNPQINGKISLNDAAMTVNYLKTTYRITDNVTVKNSIIYLDTLILHDVRNNEAVATGTVDMNHINTPTIDVDINATQFMALNTTARDNQLYYGTAFGTGLFQFHGPTNNMHIIITAKTEAGTVFNVPLNTAGTIKEDEGFLTFVSKDSTKAAPKQTSFNGLTMEFHLNVDENTLVNIYTAPGKLTGRGKTDLNLSISNDDFQMSGTYYISNGQFQFTGKEYISKNFNISSGGTILWKGDPLAALINLKAIYSTRTSLKPLYSAAGRPPTPDQRIESQAVMNLTGPLLKPDIALDLNFPTDGKIKDDLQSYLSDNNNVNLQAFSLIARGSFAEGNGTGNIADQINSTFRNAGTELAINQLNTILSQALNLKMVELNIRSFNDASASLRLWNDRLIIRGGVIDRQAQNEFQILASGDNVTTDLELQFLIKKDGSFTFKAANRLNERNFLNPTQEYISALGLVYRQDFDNFNELLQLLTGKKRKEEKDTQPAPPVITTPPAVPKPATADAAKTGSTR